MRTLALVLLAAASNALLSGCGQCAAICVHSAVLTAVDSAGGPLTIQSVTENASLSPNAGCGTVLSNTSPPTVTSSCLRFGVDVVATDGKRFSGVLDVSDGSARPPVCGSVCKTKSVTVTLQ